LFNIRSLDGSTVALILRDILYQSLQLAIINDLTAPPSDCILYMFVISACYAYVCNGDARRELMSLVCCWLVGHANVLRRHGWMLGLSQWHMA